MEKSDVRCVLFDFGGVIAEEGFRRALVAAAQRHGLDPEALVRQAMDAVYDSGFVLGTGGEAAFWQVLQEKMPFPERFEAFRAEVMRSFVLRPEMIALVDELRSAGLTVAILSDQTHWLDELDQRDGIYRHFDRVFNSYYLGKGKRDPSIFRDVIGELGCRAAEALFVDDSEGHVRRARGEGLQAIHCQEPRACIDAVRRAAVAG
ncbi:HAD family phosphatase [Guyparkeria hydrothermalis]|uniref:HAD family hydrolase n=1 Tax=Guyparkeria hydrothermalis TaxID=923 RepID=UPI002021679E|nr:HAD family phosphatase [Guyparkeria hydrothermalis]MCL7744600.1 HAD family phosphatase [Guyparkeria hydrothermalis]